MAPAAHPGRAGPHQRRQAETAHQPGGRDRQRPGGTGRRGRLVVGSGQRPGHDQRQALPDRPRRRRQVRGAGGLRPGARGRARSGSGSRDGPCPGVRDGAGSGFGRKCTARGTALPRRPAPRPARLIHRRTPPARPRSGGGPTRPPGAAVHRARPRHGARHPRSGRPGPEPWRCGAPPSPAQDARPRGARSTPAGRDGRLRPPPSGGPRRRRHHRPHAAPAARPQSVHHPVPRL